MGPDGPKWGREVLFPANPDLADILGRTDFDFEIVFFDLLGSKISKFPGPRFPNFQKSGLGPAWAPDAAAGAGRILKSRSRPLPTHPGMKYFREETLAVDMNATEC